MTKAYIVNATASQKFGWSAEEAIGKELAFAEGRPGQIIGVIDDFHYQPLSQAIEPLVLMLEETRLAFASMKVNPTNIAPAIEFVKNKWEAFEPGREFNYFFVEDDFSSRYSAEERLSEILSVFAGLAIIIACLGLFGLASYTAEQRTREIGIRKVLGASIRSIIVYLSREFVKWVLVANALAWPITYLVMRNYWLSGFPYRTDPSLMIFLIALITVGFQVVRAASANPADSLRYE